MRRVQSTGTQLCAGPSVWQLGDGVGMGVGMGGGACVGGEVGLEVGVEVGVAVGVGDGCGGGSMVYRACPYHLSLIRRSGYDVDVWSFVGWREFQRRVAVRVKRSRPERCIVWAPGEADCHADQATVRRTVGVDDIGRDCGPRLTVRRREGEADLIGKDSTGRDHGRICGPGTGERQLQNPPALHRGEF